MTAIYDCSVDSELLTGMRLARAAIGRGELVVIPTDTVYGVAADAFNPAAVAAAPRGEGPRPHLAAARAHPGHPHARRARGRRSRGRAPPRGRVLARRAHRHPARAAVAAVGPRRDARHRRAPDAGEPDRARTPLRDRAARGVLGEPHRRAVGARRRQTPRRCSATPSTSTSTAERPARPTRPIGERAGDTSSTIVDATGARRRGGSAAHRAGGGDLARADRSGRRRGTARRGIRAERRRGRVRHGRDRARRGGAASDEASDRTAADEADAAAS